MDFGFMRASTSQFGRPNKTQDRVVLSFDNFTSYLFTIDEALQHAWVFLTASKDPPIDIVKAFITQFGHTNGGSIRTDQGEKLARSIKFRDMVLCNHNYTVKPTGADSPSQNGVVKIYNNKLAICMRTLLYGAGLPAKYWSAALQHAVYLHNQLVHTVTKRMLIEGFFEFKPNIGHLKLKLFGSRVCVKRLGARPAKLDCNNFMGIFLGYMATNNNILYLDLSSGLVKQSHHMQLDKAWYLQASHPPAAQLLYDLGAEPDNIYHIATGPLTTPLPSDFHLPGTIKPIVIPWPLSPPTPNTHKHWPVPPACTTLPLPLHLTAVPETCHQPLTAAAAALTQAPLRQQRLPHKRSSIDIATDFNLTKGDMATAYLLPDPY